MRKAPCMFFPLGTCHKGKDCPYFHGGGGKGKGGKKGAAAVVGAVAATEE